MNSFINMKRRSLNNINRNVIQLNQKTLIHIDSSNFVRKLPACQKLGNSPGIGKCPAPGQCKICKCPTPGTDKAGKCPAVARARKGGGRWAQVELTDA